MVDGSCGLNQDEMIAQQEFISNMAQLIKKSSKTPRLGVMDCQYQTDPHKYVVVGLNHTIYNSMNGYEVTKNDLRELYLYIRDRTYAYSPGSSTPKYDCIQYGIDN